MAGPALKPALHSKGVGMAACRQRSHDERAEVGVQLVGGDDHTGPGLPSLTAAGRAQVDQEHVAAANHISYFHFHSRSSKRVGVGSSSRRCSPRSRTRRAASAHPDRGRRSEVITRAPSRSRTSTSSVSPASSIKGFGSRTPRELPMRTSRVLITGTSRERAHNVHTGPRRGKLSPAPLSNERPPDQHLRRPGASPAARGLSRRAQGAAYPAGPLRARSVLDTTRAGRAPRHAWPCRSRPTRSSTSRTACSSCRSPRSATRVSSHRPSPRRSESRTVVAVRSRRASPSI